MLENKLEKSKTYATSMTEFSSLPKNIPEIIWDKDIKLREMNPHFQTSAIYFL